MEKNFFNYECAICHENFYLEFELIDEKPYCPLCSKNNNVFYHGIIKGSVDGSGDCVER